MRRLIFSGSILSARKFGCQELISMEDQFQFLDSSHFAFLKSSEGSRLRPHVQKRESIQRVWYPHTFKVQSEGLIFFTCSVSLEHPFSQARQTEGTTA